MAAPVAASPLSLEDEAFLDCLASVNAAHPGNRAARFLPRRLFEEMSPEQRARLRRCCQSGVAEPNSEVGCYLLRPDDLQGLGAFFTPLIHDYHRAPSQATWSSGWEISADNNRDGLDLSALGLPPISMRARVARNLTSFDLPAAMTREARVRLERQVTWVLQALIDHPFFGGRIYSLTPDFNGVANPNLATHEERQELVAARIMFSDMDRDRFMRSAGIANDWPHGRACYVSRDREVIVWIGEEDHLRIICIKTGTSLTEVFLRLRDTVALIESLPEMRFAKDSQYGYVTSCPSNLGTAMRASVRVALPRLRQCGVDLRTLCGHVGLSVTTTADGLFELSPLRRAFMREQDIIMKLYDGVRQLSMLDAS